MLLWSEVLSDVGRVKDGAREAKGGEPQSSRLCNRPWRTLDMENIKCYTPTWYEGYERVLIRTKTFYWVTVKHYLRELA